MDIKKQNCVAAPGPGTVSSTLESQRDANASWPVQLAPSTAKELSFLDRCELLGWDEV